MITFNGQIVLKTDSDNSSFANWGAFVAHFRGTLYTVNLIGNDDQFLNEDDHL